jgi:hypothetical protein
MGFTLKLLQTLQLLHVGNSFTKCERILHNRIESKLWALCVGWKAYLCISLGTRLCTSWKTCLCISWNPNIATSSWRTIITIRNLHINDFCFSCKWFFKVVNATCNFYKCLVALDKLHKILVAKDVMWHLIEMSITSRCDEHQLFI